MEKLVKFSVDNLFNGFVNSLLLPRSDDRLCGTLEYMFLTKGKLFNGIVGKKSRNLLYKNCKNVKNEIEKNI